jgi:hypothetical protein
VARSVVSWRKWDFGFSFGVFFMAGGWSFLIIGLGFFFFFFVLHEYLLGECFCVCDFLLSLILSPKISPFIFVWYNHLFIGKIILSSSL